MTVHPVDQFRQFFCIFFCIIDTTYQTVLKRHTSAGLFKIIPAGINYFMNVIFVRHRHQLQTFFLVGSM